MPEVLVYHPLTDNYGANLFDDLGNILTNDVPLMAPTIQQASSWYELPILGPYAIAITGLTTVSTGILVSDLTRAGVIFHNPGTVAKRVVPADSTLAGGSGGIVIYPQEEFTLIRAPNMPYNINCGWIGVTDDPADGALTIFNFTPQTPGAPKAPITTRLSQQIQVTSPISLQTTLGTGSKQILAADANRGAVEFHNPGTVTLAVCPSNLPAVIGAAGSMILLPGDTKRIVGNQLVKINCAWNGIALSGASNPITALSFYG